MKDLEKELCGTVVKNKEQGVTVPVPFCSCNIKKIGERVEPNTTTRRIGNKTIF